MFGRKFRSHLTETVCSKKKIKEALIDVTKGKRKSRPFRKSPSHHQRRSGGQVWLSKGYRDEWQSRPKQRQHSNRGVQQHQCQAKSNGKYKFVQEDLPQHNFNSRVDTVVKAKQRSSSSKEIILCKEVPRSSTGRKTKTLLQCMGNVNKRLSDPVVCPGIPDPISRNTLSKENSTNSRNEYNAKTADRLGSEGDVEEGCNKADPPSSGRISQQLVPCRKERWGSSSCYKSKESEFLCPLSTLQNGGFAQSKVYATRERLHVQTRLEGRILSCSTESEIQKIRTFSMVRQLIRIPLPVFWFRTRTSNIYKTFENPSGIIATDKYQDPLFIWTTCY